MDFIVVRHRPSTHAARNQEVFVDATLVVNAESDAAALAQVSDEMPNPLVKSWNVVHVTKLDAAGPRCAWCVRPMKDGPQAYGPGGLTIMHPKCAEAAHK